MSALRPSLVLPAAAAAILTFTALASNHREAPITALDHKADITDMYAFVSYDAGQVSGRPPRRSR